MTSVAAPMIMSDAILQQRIARVADADDAAVLDADVRFDDALHGIEDQRVGDDEIEGLRIQGERRLRHAVADHLAAAELHLVAVAAVFRDEIALDFDEEFRVRETDLVAHGGAEHAGVLFAGQVHEGNEHEDWGWDAADPDAGVGMAASPSDLHTLVQRTVDEVVQAVHFARSPAKATSSTSRVSPGSKRTAVPAGMLSRKPGRPRGRKSRRGIHLEEMEMAAHLDGPVAGVGDHQAFVVSRPALAGRSGRVREDE